MVAYAAFGCEYLFRKVYPIRYEALESGFWDARWDLNPRHMKAMNLPALTIWATCVNNNFTKHSWLVVSGSSELQKTSTITNNINNANYIFYLLWTLFEVHSPYIICPIPWMSGKSHLSLRKKRKLTIITWLFGTYSIFLMGCTIGFCLWFYLCHTLRAVLHHPVFQLALLEVESVDVRLVAR